MWQPIPEIMTVVMDLRGTKLNSLALENAAEVALRTEYTELAWSLLRNFTYLRPHFFWPILLSAGRLEGEIGMTKQISVKKKLF